MTHPHGKYAGVLTNKDQNAWSGFQTFHTLPARSGPGFSVGLPGCQPEGVTSPVATTCWKALTWRISSATLRPTSGVRTSIARILKSGSIRNLPRISTPAVSSYTPYIVPTRPPASDRSGKGTPPSTILESSSSCQILCENRLSVLSANTSTPNAWSSPYLTATAVNSVGQTKVKSPG